MKVVEIFNSIQGEGTWMGKYVTFLRLAGCNLKCPFCDEAFKYDKAHDMTIDEIVDACEQLIVVITGGEPSIQPQLPELISALHKQHHVVYIETNGTTPISYIGDMQPDWVTVSPKAESDYVIRTTPDEIKIVVDDTVTLEQIMAIHSKYPRVQIWLQPCDGPFIKASMDRILQFIKTVSEGHLSDGCTWAKAGIQLHKYYGAQ